MPHRNKFAGLNAYIRRIREDTLRDRLFASFLYAGKFWYFITLSYDPAHWPANFKPNKINLQALSSVPCRNYAGFKADKRAWIKKLQRKFGPDLSFHFVAELTKAGAPHYHVVVGTASKVSKAAIKRTWTKGIVDVEWIRWASNSCRMPDFKDGRSAYHNAKGLATYVRKDMATGGPGTFGIRASSSRDFTKPPTLTARIKSAGLTSAQTDDFRRLPNTEPLALLLKSLLPPKKSGIKYAMRLHKDGQLDFNDVVDEPIPLKEQPGPVKVLMMQIKNEVRKEGFK